MKALTASILTSALVATNAVYSQQANQSSFSPYVDPDGAITRPTNYRTQWAHLGSFAVIPGEEVEDPAAPGFHDVYTQPSTVEAYRKSGQFPDGAVLVKEIRTLDSAIMTTGEAYWAAEPSVWFVMVKNRKGRFPNNPKWGDGWGWALFKAENPSVDVSKNYKEDCLSCHLPAKETDWVYVQGYPTLK